MAVMRIAVIWRSPWAARPAALTDFTMRKESTGSDRNKLPLGKPLLHVVVAGADFCLKRHRYWRQIVTKRGRLDEVAANLLAVGEEQNHFATPL